MVILKVELELKVNLLLFFFRGMLNSSKSSKSKSRIHPEGNTWYEYLKIIL